MRALSAIVHFAVNHCELDLKISSDDLIELLDSLDWTDRNKAIAVLMELTERNDEAVLAKLRDTALPVLAEMARWHSPGHALGAYVLLCRAADISGKEAVEAWQRGDREDVIARALKSASER